MALKTQGKNEMLNHLANLMTYVSLHSEYPATPANEISGGGYERQEVLFNPASAGAITASNKPEFSVAAGTTIAAAAFWSASISGTMYADSEVVPETYANPGFYTLDVVKLEFVDE